MKAILMMEMPESCIECPMEMNVVDTRGKLWKGNICRGCGMRNADRSKKPDWCPLVSMPERKEIRSYSISIADGWNACIDAIEGGEESERAR